MMQQNQVQRVVLLLFAFLFISLLFPYLPGHGGDNSLWADWSWHIRTYGLRQAYGSGSNYLPLYQWFLWIYGKLVGNPDHIGLRIGYLRCFTLAFDFIGLWYACKWLNRRIDPVFFLLFNLLNIAYSYNTVIWGQVDGIMATLVFVSLYYAHKEKLLISSLLFLLAVNMKLQAIIFLPLWGLICIYTLVRLRSLRPLLYILPAMALLQVLIILPFLLEPGAAAKAWSVVTHSVDMYPRVSMNAYNLWYWVCRQNPWDVSDGTRLVAGLTYKAVGLLLFFAGSAFALWPVLRMVWRRWRGDDVAIDRRKIWLSGALVAVLFFFVNTQMHERYCHGAFIFLAAWSFDRGRFLPYILFSLAYFLNLEGVLQFMKLPNYHTLIFHPRFVSILFSLLLLYLFRQLYTKSNR